MRSRVCSENRLLLIIGGRLCVTVAQRLLCINGERSVRHAFRLGTCALSRRHFFRNLPATCDSVAALKGREYLCYLCGVSPYGAASGNRQLQQHRKIAALMPLLSPLIFVSFC
jgi:hypothetical protein